jgi:hypothetical protein
MSATDREKALEALGKLSPWRADDRDAWLKVGMALHSVSDDLLDAWDAWSQQSEKYTQKECAKQWRSFKAGKGIGIGTLLAMGKEDSGMSSSPAAPRKVAPPKTTSKPKATYETFAAAQTAALAQAQGEATKKKLDVTQVRFGEKWKYPGERWVLRFNLPAKAKNGKVEKSFRPVHRNGHGYVVGDPPGLWPLYRSDELPTTGSIVVCEGEKVADEFWKAGIPATTSAHGAQSPDKSDWSILAGRDLIASPDNDAAGEGYITKVSGIVARLHRPAAVRVVRLPDMPEASDFADWVGPDGPMGCKSAEEIKAAFMALAAVASPASTPATPRSRLITPYKAFPADVLPEPLCSFVTMGAAAMCCDPAFVALPLLAACAAAIGNTRRIELKRGWSEPAIIWTAIVGESGTVKSPPLELALSPLRQRQHRAIKEFEQQMEEYKAQTLQYEKDLATWKKAKKDSGPPPVEPKEPLLPRFVCDDATVEALAVLLQQNWRGLLMARDELAAWIGAFDRYVQNKGADAARWIEMFGGRPMTIDRKTGNTKIIYIERAAVSITGGIQPGTLKRALAREHFENGLAARLLCACPPRRVKKWTETEIGPAMIEAVRMIFETLYTIEPIEGYDGGPAPGLVLLSPAAKKIWIDFYNAHAKEQMDFTGDLSAAWSKLEGYAARFALVIHLVRWAAGDSSLRDMNVVDERSISAGITLSKWFGYETARVYAILAEDGIGQRRRELIELVQRMGGRVTERDLAHHSRAHQGTGMAEKALNLLVGEGYGCWEDVVPTNKGGRPTRCFVLNPDASVAKTYENRPNSEVVVTDTPEARPDQVNGEANGQ